MLAKIQKSYCFLIILDTIGIALARTKRSLCGLLDILVSLTRIAVNTRTLKNKLYAILLIGCTVPVTLLEGDATATVLAGLIAVPMFFAKESWTY